MNAYLILENGKVFEGTSVGCTDQVIFEMVFNTSMTGYQEVMTDKSYIGQGVVMTYPLIGNCGVICDSKPEDSRVSAVIVREIARAGSNFRGDDNDTSEFMAKYNVAGICGVDTRALTKILRESGTMNAMITTNPDFVIEEILPVIKAFKIENPVKDASTKEIYTSGDGRNVVVIDMGSPAVPVKLLNENNFKATVVPYNTSFNEIIKLAPMGIVVTNGPGNPKDCTETIETLKEIIKTDIPVLGVSLGHQLIALAAGADTAKLKYGHHGANHPVKEIESGEVYITSQNHIYTVVSDSVDESVAKISYINVNDKSVEGMKYVGKKIYTTQFLPETSVGPRNANKVFDKFVAAL